MQQKQTLAASNAPVSRHMKTNVTMSVRYVNDFTLEDFIFDAE